MTDKIVAILVDGQRVSVSDASSPTQAGWLYPIPSHENGNKVTCLIGPERPYVARAGSYTLPPYDPENRRII